MKRTILLIDDESDIVQVVKFRLESLGFAVVTAQSGEEGLAKAKTEKADLILLDVILGDTTGFEVCKKIKNEIDPQAKVIIYTAKIDGVDAKKARESGADAFTVKTGDMDPIKEAIDKVIGLEK
ncbi:MAG: response regulator [Candidatus Omnitrophota bacterium]